jgi:agmatine deiminase
MWTIPPEQNLHSQTWLAYPWDRRIWGSDLSVAQRTVTKLIRVISSYEPVRLLALPIFERSLSKRFAASEIEIVPANYNDIWVRDTLPTFAVSAEPALIAIDWHFNGWGKIPGLPYMWSQRAALLRSMVTIPWWQPKA